MDLESMSGSLPVMEKLLSNCKVVMVETVYQIQINAGVEVDISL
jgi:hypothetical protein